MSSAIQVNPKMLVGIQKIGPSSFNETEKAGANFGNQLWHEFIGKVLEAGISLNRDMYGVSWPADELVPPQSIYYFCGFESNDQIKAFDSLLVEGGKYFEYRYEGFAVDIDKGFQDAYMNAFPKSGLKARAGQHLEIYGDEYDPEAPVSIFKILIPCQ
jgi:predicted transcriptional regulator YdeE